MMRRCRRGSERFGSPSTWSSVANSQTTQVNVDAYKSLSTTVYLRIVEEFPWAQIKPSIHGLMAHAGQLIEENDGYGLGGKAEHGTERGQQELKGWRLRGSRKTNLYDNMKDALNRMAQASSPYMRVFDRLRKWRNRAKTAVNEKRMGLTELVNSLFVDGVAPKDAFQSTIHPEPEVQQGGSGIHPTSEAGSSNRTPR